MSKTITIVEATKNKFTSVEILPNYKRKVAGYARVSTDLDEQFTSFEAQKSYYTSYIKSHPEWKFVRVYADEGISGTHTEHREGFQRMIKDAKDGKIDLILTKSISRFARNTLDTLSTIRELKERGIEVHFEKENIWTLDSKSEMMLTFMASFAQEESRSISENIRWAINKKFEKGRFSLPYKCFLGYDRGEDGLPVINEKEAQVVRTIYTKYLSGESPDSIARYLESRNVPTPRGQKKWSTTTINSILRNEKYSGNAVLQKHYSIDFLDKRRRVNNGEMKKYYINDSHEAIISQEEYDLVQIEIENRKSVNHLPYASGLFSGKIRCGQCGGFFGAKTWHSTDKYRRTIYRCNRKYGPAGKECDVPHVTEDFLKDVVVKAANKLLDNRESIIKDLEEIKNQLFGLKELEKERGELEAEADVSKALISKSISSGPITNTEKHDALEEKYHNTVKRLDEVREEIVSIRNKRLGMNSFIRNFKSSEQHITEFSPELFVGLVDHITVFSRSRVVVTFRDGRELSLDM